MTFKSLCYAALHDTTTADGPAKAAVDLAASLKAHLTVVIGSPQVFAPMLYPSPMLASIEVEVNEREKLRLGERGEEIRKQAQLAGVTIEVHVLSDVLYGVYKAVADFTRVADLSVAQMPASDDGVLRDFVVDIVRNSGGPVLLVPEKAVLPKSFRRIIVAWDGGLEAARAMRHALPFIEEAESVEIISVNETTKTDAKPMTANLAAAHLARHCRNVTEVILPSDGGVATTILNHAALTRTDLVVMGFYGHSRVREWAFGGATRDMLQREKMPLLVAN